MDDASQGIAAMFQGILQGRMRRQQEAEQDAYNRNLLSSNADLAGVDPALVGGMDKVKAAAAAQALMQNLAIKKIQQAITSQGIQDDYTKARTATDQAQLGALNQQQAAQQQFNQKMREAIPSAGLENNADILNRPMRLGDTAAMTPPPAPTSLLQAPTDFQRPGTTPVPFNQQQVIAQQTGYDPKMLEVLSRIQQDRDQADAARRGETELQLKPFEDATTGYRGLTFGKQIIGTGYNPEIRSKPTTINLPDGSQAVGLFNSHGGFTAMQKPRSAQERAMFTASAMKEMDALNKQLAALPGDNFQARTRIIDALGQWQAELDANKGTPQPAPSRTQAIAVPGAEPTVTTQDDFDKLPSGSIYKSSDGKRYRKP